MRDTVFGHSRHGVMKFARFSGRTAANPSQWSANLRLEDRCGRSREEADMGPSSKGLAYFAMATVTLATAPAGAASFDCNKAATADEQAICASYVLSDLDTQLATLYGVRMQIPMLMGARGAAQDEQRTWLTQRHACGGDVACIVQSYQQRIAELKQTITEAMQDYCKRVGICE
jgi:uncharacterized protein YecT (DUF1311 family)